MCKKNPLIYIASFAICLVFIAGCQKYFDTSSPYQNKSTLVLKTEKGFTDGLTGIYLQMGSESLYGKELQYGFLSILARSWDTTMTANIGDKYYHAARYNYSHPAVKSVINNIWSGSYSCIANINVLLSNIDSKKDIFTGNNYSITKAELLALRAYLHFDLLRMFGPDNPTANLSAIVMPYMDTISVKTQTYISANEVINRCIADLLEARQLLPDKSIVKAHLGYWGITGLLSRISLYKGDYANAKTYASEVITGNAYPLSTSQADFWFQNEMLVYIYVYTTILNSYETSFFNSTYPVGLSPNGQTALFVTGNGNANDWRKLNQYVTTTGTTTPAKSLIIPKKLSQYTNAISATNLIPLMRVSEMYFISAECACQQKDTLLATSLINTVRRSKNLTTDLPLLTTTNVQVELQKEYMKEYIGEAQAFYYFKRKNLNFNSLPFMRVTPITGAVYAFPVPE